MGKEPNLGGCCLMVNFVRKLVFNYSNAAEV